MRNLYLLSLVSVFLFASPSFAKFRGVSSGGGADSCAVPSDPYLYTCKVSGQTLYGHWTESFTFDNQTADEPVKGQGKGQGFTLNFCPEQKGNSALSLNAYATYDYPGPVSLSASGEVQVPWNKKRFDFQFGLTVHTNSLFYKVECEKLK